MSLGSRITVGILALLTGAMMILVWAMTPTPTTLLLAAFCLLAAFVCFAPSFSQWANRTLAAGWFALAAGWPIVTFITSHGKGFDQIHQKIVFGLTGVAAGVYAIAGSFPRWSELQGVFQGKRGKSPVAPVGTYDYGTHDGSAADHSLLAECRKKLGASPRMFSFRQKLLFHASPPSWLGALNPLKRIYRQQRRLRSDGRVVWGHIVQANRLLHSKGKGDYPACIVYSADPWFDDNPQILVEITGILREIRDTRQTTADLAEISRLLSDQYEDIPRLRLPEPVAGGRELFLTSTVIVRKHLAEGYLSGRLFPILILPEVTPAVLVVPSPFWPTKLLESWRYQPAELT